MQRKVRCVEALGSLGPAFRRPSVRLAEGGLPVCREHEVGRRRTGPALAGIDPMAAAHGHPAIGGLGSRDPDLEVACPVLTVASEQRVVPARLGHDIAGIALVPDRGRGGTGGVGDEAAGERLEGVELAASPGQEQEPETDLPECTAHRWRASFWG
jgi:hypothetical protein